MDFKDTLIFADYMTTLKSSVDKSIPGLFKMTHDQRMQTFYDWTNTVIATTIVKAFTNDISSIDRTRNNLQVILIDHLNQYYIDTAETLWQSYKDNKEPSS